MHNLQGIFLVIGAMLGFTLGDVFVKQLSSTHATGQILFAMGGISALIFAAIARVRGARLLQRAAWQPLLVLRAVADGGAAMFFTSALARVDLSTVAAVFQTLPLVITLGAALFLKETVGWRRWSAVIVGFCGVLLIIRPGFEGFDPDTLLVLGAVALIATRDLITRRADVAVSSYVLAVQGMGALSIAGVILLVLSPRSLAPMDIPELGFLAGAVIFNTLGYWGIVIAMRIGEASVVAPFRYTRLVFSVMGGILVFGERPNPLTMTGAALIIGSGLYTFLRERHHKQSRTPARTQSSSAGKATQNVAPPSSLLK
ncbi:DMT family transporter [Shimia aestuarii]|uniref:Permease of the drug/metabolite transporter (DMT) superfamily n=1 Tax=Shimia aestuarii TaxID=254406 RepID=A0A1I4NDK2_9RHOB|nr:DMT family transporter [Shimia aestuarii]SFM13578.1 Permease of the drug/metabolite transporter (DMT) superfamily [Shimia aestuarii]